MLILSPLLGFSCLIGFPAANVKSNEKQKYRARGADSTNASLEQKIAWIKEAAGPREADLELSQTIFDMEITDSAAAPAPQSGGWVVPRRTFSTEQAVAHLLEQRERYGFSYLQISQRQMENFAPVLVRLAGK